jgi:hypothetical protein
LSRGMRPLPEDRATGRQPECVNHSCYRSGWLGPCRPEEGGAG